MNNSQLLHKHLGALPVLQLASIEHSLRSSTRLQSTNCALHTRVVAFLRLF